MSANNDLKQGIFLDTTSVDIGDIDFTQLMAQLNHWQLANVMDEHQLNQALQGADVVVSNKVKLSRDVLKQHASIKLICIAATGTNNVDLQAAQELGIKVCNVTAYATASVVQHVFSLILALTTRFKEVDAAVRRGEWCDSQQFALLKYSITELAGKTMGIVGYGELGQAVANVAKAFDMQVLIAKRNDDDQRSGRMALHDMLSKVDVLSLHCPLTDETENLINETEFALMKSTALLINTARGGIVNEQALLQALQTGSIAGAGIDVLTTEPPSSQHPLLSYQADHLIVTPHVAWASQQSRQRLIDQIARNIKAFKQGRPRNLV